MTLDKRGLFLLLQGDSWGVVISCPPDDELRVRKFAAAVEGAVSAVRAKHADVEAKTKICPDCAETIRAAAHVCRYCGYRYEA